MSLRRLRKSDSKRLSAELPVDLDPKRDIQMADDAILVDGTLWFVKNDGRWIPAIPLLLERPDLLPRLVVDMGAVPHVAQGADVMRPGITEIPDTEKGALVQVVDATHGKPLAVGEMLFSAAKMRDMGSGKAVRSLHHVGDAVWKVYTHS